MELQLINWGLQMVKKCCIARSKCPIVSNYIYRRYSILYLLEDIVKF